MGSKLSTYERILCTKYIPTGGVAIGSTWMKVSMVTVKRLQFESMKCATVVHKQNEKNAQTIWCWYDSTHLRSVELTFWCVWKVVHIERRLYVSLCVAKVSTDVCNHRDNNEQIAMLFHSEKLKFDFWSILMKWNATFAVPIWDSTIPRTEKVQYIFISIFPQSFSHNKLQNWPLNNFCCCYHWLR